ncbi:7-cyano-7-deazaguanine synthase QueC [Roseofilum sp. BLCC_M154]|uniref:Multifunctional fusion protein n=1 Tax=Roseofilum acuticapitatum BLCC-M154 TaxID=3022444 RepID=A0ABT7AN48_9CYAN|nr:7-cyano-7-deazaguanine synthase QueC [Roseofilum acuticapitatum]MDJ1168311.1 7-cyano-7-deazaguanine synthase QueC [Roseofilum acuticapitatum BLCC-M154]
MAQTEALVILSGGQDSTTCAALATQQFDRTHGLTFDYQQRHRIELESAQAVAKKLGLASHEILSVGPILASTSPLVSQTALAEYESAEALPGGIEATFIPGRNILFLTLAANRAARLGIRDIVLGVCETDFAGYWDCRQSFIDAMGVALGEGMYGDGGAYRIHTPLMNLTKAESVKLAQEVLGDRFESVMELTHTCYAGVKGGCGKCHACILRDRGFQEAGIDDPIWKYRGTVVEKLADDTYGDRAIEDAATSPLEIWPNPSPNHDYLIHVEHPEFTALCPRSGYPDFGTIVFDYFPNQSVLELKAFKLYINSFRQQRISHETVVNQVADRLMAEVQPKALRIIGDFTRRGGVKTVITAYRGENMNFPEYQPNLL